MSILHEVKSWMQFFGWSDGGSPGSLKRDVDGKVIAHAGDATWVKDMEDCCERAERQRIIAEIERRESLRR